MLNREEVEHDHSTNCTQDHFVQSYKESLQSNIKLEMELAGKELKQDDLGHLISGNSPVFAYIRRGRGIPKNRKVHFTYCQAILSKPAEKFFCSNRYDGMFEVDIEDGRGNKIMTEAMALAPCEFCVGKYYGLTKKEEDRAERHKIIGEFDWYNISTEIGTTLNRYAWRSTLYQFTDKTWEEISRDVREQAKWTCSKCHIVVGEDYGVFLHTHHQHGDRNFNHPSNLVSLCIRCHAEEPGHENLKNTQYYKFLEGIESGRFVYCKKLTKISDSEL